jgi:DNA gyrase subunit B
MIPLLDGTEVSIKELSDRIKNGEEIWSYSIQDGTKAIVPSKIIWCDLTRKNSELYRVTLDDGTYIDTTPDHEYMLRDGSFKRADKLTKGESLMPFYTKKSEKKKDRIVGYEKVFNPSTGKYKFTHTMVSHECVRDLENEKIIGEQFDTHHIDFNKLNNHPKNLSRMRHSDHFKLHVEHFNKILGSPEVVKKRMDGIDRYLRSEKRRQRLSKEMTGVYNRYFENYNNSELHVKHNIIGEIIIL